MDRKYIFDKLVRDEVVSRMQKYCSDIEYKKITEKKEGIKLFQEKFLEEMKEVFDAKDSDELASEIADVIEVAYGYAKFSGIERERIENARLKKIEERGAFQESFYIHSVKLDEKHPMATYLQKSPDKYPESSD